MIRPQDPPTSNERMQHMSMMTTLRLTSVHVSWRDEDELLVWASGSMVGQARGSMRKSVSTRWTILITKLVDMGNHVGRFEDLVFVL